MCSRLNSCHRGNATVIALIALVTALLALMVAFLALMRGGGPASDREPMDRPAPAVQPVTPEKTPDTPPVAVQPILPDTGPPAEQPAPTPEAPVTEPAPEPGPAPTPETPVAAETEMTTTVPEPATPPAPVVAAPEPADTPAGRPSIPEEGEEITEPIPAERLVKEPTEPAPTGVIDWSEAKNHVGQEITARGTVVNTNNIGDLTFLNFDTDWQDKFYIVIFREAYDDVPSGNPELAYLNKTIEVSGEVSTHRGRPQIQVRDASQIKVVDDQP